MHKRILNKALMFTIQFAIGSVAHAALYPVDECSTAGASCEIFREFRKSFESAGDLSNLGETVGGYLGTCAFAHSQVDKDVEMLFGYFDTQISGPAFWGANLANSGRIGLAWSPFSNTQREIDRQTLIGLGARRENGSYVSFGDDAFVPNQINYQTAYRWLPNDQLISKISYDLKREARSGEGYCTWYKKTFPTSKVPPRFRDPADKYFLCGEAVRSGVVYMLSTHNDEVSNVIKSDQLLYSAAGCVTNSGKVECHLFAFPKVGIAIEVTFNQSASIARIVDNFTTPKFDAEVSCRNISNQEAMNYSGSLN